MNIQIILSALNYNIDNMHNINFPGDILIINQTNNATNSKYINNEGIIQVLNYLERGIGKSRKEGILKSKGDIIVFADDDEKFKDNVTEIIRSSYKKYNDADLILFNVERLNNGNRPKPKASKTKKLNYFNILRYGAVNITAKRSSLKSKNILFDADFGTKRYPFGEDSIFLYDCLKRGLRIYYVDETIAEVEMSDSTWFRDYDEKFFQTKGAQFFRLSSKFSFLLMIQFIIRRRGLYKDNLSSFKAFKNMIIGRRNYKYEKNKSKE